MQKLRFLIALLAALTWRSFKEFLPLTALISSVIGLTLGLGAALFDANPFVAFAVGFGLMVALMLLLSLALALAALAGDGDRQKE